MVVVGIDYIIVKNGSDDDVSEGLARRRWVKVGGGDGGRGRWGRIVMKFFRSFVSYKIFSGLVKNL